jgi:starvation-inducible outer membrane lipoprotein
MVNVTVEYTLKNESDKNINNQQVVFSSLKVNDINDWFITESIEDENEKMLEKLFLFSSENNYPKNLKITF